MELILQTNLSLSTSQLHIDLINIVEETRTSLAELLELVKNLTKREGILARAVNETAENLEVKIMQSSSYSRIVRDALVNSMVALTTANTTRNQVDEIFELFISSRANLLDVRENLTNANQLLQDILRLRGELIDIANQSDSISQEQNQTVNSLRQRSYILLDNTTESLANICETVENENATAVHLRGIQNCTIPDLDQLLAKAQIRLQDAVSNSSAVLNRSMLIYDRVLSLVVPDYNSEQLLNDSLSSLEEAEELMDNIESQTNETVLLEDAFKVINTTVNELSARIEYLDSTATDLTERARNAFTLANTSVISAEKVIEDAQFLLDELQQRLDELIEFFERYDSLVKLVRRAENVSEEAVNESENQLSEIQRIASVIENIDTVLQGAVEKLNTAIQV